MLAKLHKLKPTEIGLSDFGSQKAFYPRQIKFVFRSSLLSIHADENCRSLTTVSQAQSAIRDLKTDEAVGEIPGFEFLTEWYGRNLPIGDQYEGGLVHGDYKADNFIFHPTKPIIIGVLDWELSTLVRLSFHRIGNVAYDEVQGHPLSDLANLLMPFYVPASDDPAIGSNPLLTSLRFVCRSL